MPTQNTANIDGWAEFTFDFVTPGGAVPAVGAGTATLPASFWVTSYDTDGSGTLREFVEFLGIPASSTGLSAGTTLSSGTSVDGGVQYQSGTAGAAGVSTLDIYKASAAYSNVASFKLVYGARTGSSGSAAGGRLTAFDFFKPDAVFLRPEVNGYKSVKLTTDADGNGVITPGDTLTYTVTYVNTGNAAVSNFQITDALPAGLTLTAIGAQTVTGATKNALYTGAGIDTLLATGQTLAADSAITVSIPVTVGTVADNTTLNNQATSTVAGATVSSDNVDSTTVFAPSVTAASGFGGVPAGSIVQTQNATTDPTTVNVRRPPQLTLNKSIAAPGRVNPADQFTVQIKNGATVTASVTTSGVATTATTGAQTLTNGTAYTLTEVMATGSVSALSAYTTAVTCTNATTGSSTTLPSGAGQSFSITPTLGDVITCTLTNTPLVLGISGQVYEDFNYGGGAGRAYNATQGMSQRLSVRVELYNSANAFIAAAFTNASGAYSFTGQLPGTYKVRIVNSFVTSSRTGACAQAVNVSTPPATCTQLPVQTYINGNGNQVGGAAPAGADPALSTTTLPAGAQSVASVTLSAGNVSGVDFGFNFDTIVNTNDSGQGSLRQFIVNSSALGGEASLAQAGQTRSTAGTVTALPAARESSIFMLTDGAAHPGLTAGLPSQVSGTVATIAPASNLPDITGTNSAFTVLDGGTQSFNVANSNTATLGYSQGVGTGSSTVSALDGPEVVITGSGARDRIFNINATSDITVANLAFLRTTGINQISTITVNGVARLSVSGNSFNVSTSFTDPGTGNRIQDAVAVNGVNSATSITNNVFGFLDRRPILTPSYIGQGNLSGTNKLDGLTVQGNQIVVTGLIQAGSQADGEGIILDDGWKNVAIRGNLFDRVAVPKGDNAIEVFYRPTNLGGLVIEDNTIQNGGNVGIDLFDTSGTSFANSSGKVTLIQRNVVTGTLASSGVGGDGIEVQAQGVTISQNSFYNNARLGINLGPSFAAADGVTPNDGLISATQANRGQDYPIFTAASISGTTLTVAGYVGSAAGQTVFGNSLIEIFKADNSPANQDGEVIVGDGKSVPHGEGRTYLGSLTAAANGTFSGTLTVSGLTVADSITATATLSNNTSEFSYNVAVTANPPVVTLLKLGRNVTKNTAFTDGTGSVNASPKDVIEYCLVYGNTGGAAPNFKLIDNVPAGLDALPDAYTSGKGIRSSGTVIAAGATATPTGTDLTNAADTDAGTLTFTGGTFSKGVMTLDLGAAGLAAGGKGTACFQARVP
ncbi:beta strand repeat-containing protein [Deinococcus sp.]|uniref:beta strand repeat-containing protein n=1 Tax=Deinococcus sp. TaxID=47478 RepID=UPI003B5A5BCD